LPKADKADQLIPIHKKVNPAAPLKGDMKNKGRMVWRMAEGMRSESAVQAHC
jgi:hypothetical protein